MYVFLFFSLNVQKPKCVYRKQGMDCNRQDGFIVVLYIQLNNVISYIVLCR